MDTFEDNPPLFREYMSAPPDVRAIMDNQFKNVKTHARLLSKAMWYEWRMKLLDGLKEGLSRIGDDFLQDAKTLSQQEQMLEPIIPNLVQEHEKLEAEANLIQSRADELANCDQEELQDARDKLALVEDEIESKCKQVEELQAQLAQHEEGIEQATERKSDCLLEIQAAEQVCEECRGWTIAEVAALKGTSNADARQSFN